MDLPEVRASDAEREHAVDVLRHAATEGQLTMAELDERVGDAYEARTRGELELAGERVQLTVFSLMGGADIRVPDGLNLEVSQFAFMGGNDVDIGVEHPSPGGPVLELRLFSVMGGSDVKRGRKLSRSERKELKRRRRQELDP